MERALERLVRDGIAVPVTIDGIAKGDWYAHAEVIERTWRARTVVLSPFDDLVSDRDYTEALFDFHFRLEIYVPKAERRWGYFVLPILHGTASSDVDPRFDRATRVPYVRALHAEPGTGERDGAAAAVRSASAIWLGAGELRVEGLVPRGWRRSFDA